MARLPWIGRIFFALATLALGVEHFVFREFVTGGRPPWPSSIAGEPVWAFLSGSVLVACSVAILLGRHARLAALVIGALVALWALPRHLPALAADPLLGPAWTSVARALKMSGGACAVAATLPVLRGRGALFSGFGNRDRGLVILGRIGLASHMIVAGILHFRYTASVASLIPGWFPGDPVFWTRFAGVALIAGGIGLNVPRTARTAALLSGIMIFSWFWIVHVPRTLAGVGDHVSIFGALASAGIAFVLAGDA